MPYKDPKAAYERQKKRYREDPEYRARQLARSKRWRDANPEKMREAQKRWEQADPERRKAVKRRWLENHPGHSRAAHLRRKHGLRVHELAELWESQDGRCYLCREPLDLAEVHVDHDHRCCPDDHSCAWCRRGLVHKECNVSIGHAGDSPEMLRRWADNLEAAQRAVTERLAGRSEQLKLELA